MVSIRPSLIEQIKVRWREFRREPSAFFWVMFMPILWMLGLGFAFSDPKPEVYSVGWQQTASGELSAMEEKIAAIIMEHPQLKVKTGTRDQLNSWLRVGEISLIFEATPSNVLAYRFDPANPEAARGREFLDNTIQVGFGRTNPVTGTIDVVKSKGNRYVDFLIPGLLGLSIMSTSLFGVGMTIVSNRKENLLKRYVSTPMPGSDFIYSHIVGRMIALFVELTSILVAGWLVFNFAIYGNFLSFVFVAIMGAAAFTSIALLCGSRTRNIPFLAGLANLIMISMTMVGGVFFSNAAFPDWMRSIVRYLPITALIDSLRKIALEGQTLSQLTFEMGILAAFTVVCAVLANRMFKWY